MKNPKNSATFKWICLKHEKSALTVSWKKAWNRENYEEKIPNKTRVTTSK